MLALFDKLERRFSLSWLVVLGRSSLLMYVIHVALIAFVLDEWFQGQTLPAFLALYGVMAGQPVGAGVGGRSAGGAGRKSCASV